MQLAQVLPHPQLIFPSKPGFVEIIWIFSGMNHFKITISHILSPNLINQLPFNPAHQDLSNNTKGTFQFLWNFQLWFNLIFIEEIIQYSRRKVINETLYNFLVDYFSKNFYQLYLLEAFIHSFFRGNSFKLYIFGKKNIFLKVYFKKIRNIYKFLNILLKNVVET